MARQRSAEDEYISITAEDMSRFHRNARSALQRRGGGFMAESIGGSLELIVLGATPLVGMLWFDWSAIQLLTFLITGTWVSMLCDFARLALARRGVKAFVDAHYDDWHVWVVVEALRSGRTTAPRSHLKATHQPGPGVFVDLAAGGFSTALMVAAIVMTLRKHPEDVLFDRAFAISIACTTAYQTIVAAWEIARYRRGGDGARPVQATPGVRGVGLFLLMFITLTLGDPDASGGLAARRVMLAVNGVIVGVGVLNGLSVIWLQRETQWLRTYVREHAAEVERAQLEPAKTKKKKRSRR